MARSWPGSLGVVLVTSAAVVVVACGGDDNLSIPSGDDGGGDVVTPDASGDDGSTPPDTGAPDTGTVCANAGSRAQCFACCVQQDPTGAATLIKAEAQCACVPELCGPIEAGAGADSGADGAAADGGADDGGGNDAATDAGGGVGGDGGASVLGTGACADTCSAGKAPDPACRKCLNEATGTKQNPGQCFTEVASACQANTDCTAYTACTSTCK